MGLGANLSGVSNTTGLANEGTTIFVGFFLFLSCIFFESTHFCFC